MGMLSQSDKSKSIEDVSELRQRITKLEAREKELLAAVETLHLQQEKYSNLLDESSDPIFSFAPDGTYRYVNRAFAEGVGKKAEEILDKKLWDIFPQEEADKRFAAVKWVFEYGETRVIEVKVPREGGDHYYITTIKPVFASDSKVEMVVCISKDITDRKRMEEELRFLSSSDMLTGLCNRNFFEKEMERLQHSQLFPISIIIIDMDKLKAVNDRYGHSVGDDLIKKVAQILTQSFRMEDIIARLGGDEFAVLLAGVDEKVAALAVKRLRENLEKNKDSMLVLSIGVATGEVGASLDEVMRLADDRMYLDKDVHRKNK
jgi:diguanylate cyclase (GGDEF)-like protein/PAS domain S-box-containing protein